MYNINKVKVLLKKLLDEYRDNLEYKKILDICMTISSPIKLKTSNYKNEGKIAIVDQSNKYISGWINISVFLPMDEYIVFGDHTEIIKYVNFPFIQGADGLKILKVNKSVNAKYIYYCFLSFYRKTGCYKRHWSNAKKTEIPIPPLDIQNKIVEILDSFTNYKAELTARIKQYEYCRDKLLDFSKNKQVEYKMLKISEISLNTFAGGTPNTSNPDYYNGDIKWLRSGEINFNKIKDTEKKITQLGLDSSSARLIKPYSVLIAMTGATVGRVGVNEVEISANQSVCAIEPNSMIVNYKFLFYVLWNDYKKIKNKGKGVLTSLTVSDIKKLAIPIPPLDIQNKIVEILDSFSS